MFKIILAISSLLATGIGVWLIPEFTYLPIEQSRYITTDSPTNVDGSNIKQSENSELNDISITKTINQYFNFAAEGRFADINKIVIKPPTSHKIFIDVETKANNKTLSPVTSNTNLKSNKIKETSSQSSADSSLSVITTKKLLPEYIRRNKLRIIKIKVLWLRDEEAKAEVDVADNEQNNLFQTIYFHLSKDRSGEWRIFKTDLIDLDANK